MGFSAHSIPDALKWRLQAIPSVRIAMRGLDQCPKLLASWQSSSQFVSQPVLPLSVRRRTGNGRSSRAPISAINLSIVLKSQVLGRRPHCIIEAIHKGKVAGLQHDIGCALAPKRFLNCSIVLIAD